jgi:hypothetical protein
VSTPGRGRRGSLEARRPGAAGRLRAGLLLGSDALAVGARGVDRAELSGAITSGRLRRIGHDDTIRAFARLHPRALASLRLLGQLGPVF